MSNKAITITIAIRITGLRCCSPQVSYLIVDEADNDMDMGKVFFYSFIIIDMDILNAPIIKNMLYISKRLDLLQDPFLEAGISVPDELPYLRFNNLEPPHTIYQTGG